MDAFPAPPFRDRHHGGVELAHRLARFSGAETLVLGIPRGGVETGIAVANALSARFDVVVARKLGAPRQPELAIGAVTADGGLFVDREAVKWLRVSTEYLDRVIASEAAEARRRERLFRGDLAASPVAGRIVIIVDDGLATGATARAAVRSVREKHPARLILAAPVASPEAMAELAAEADEVVTIMAPADFQSVGAWYADFRQLTDKDVIGMISNWRGRAMQSDG